MSVLPSFHTDPVRSVLALAPKDPRYIGPDRLAKLTAVLMLGRDDIALATLFGRAWRSGAPADLLHSTLASYACAHGLDYETIDAIEAAAHYVPLDGDDATDVVALLATISELVIEGVSEALAADQESDEPCCCPLCIAEAASLN